MIIKKESKLGTKITLFSVLLLTACVLLLSFVASNSLSSVAEKQLNNMERELQASVLNAMRESGNSTGEKVATLLQKSFVAPITLAQTFSDSAQQKQLFSREQMRAMNQSALKANANISSIYSQFEANAYDNKDAEFAGQLNHSTNEGSLEIYWVRENNQLVFYPTESAEEKYKDTLNKHGIRENEWFMCPKELLKPCALDPYLYEIDPGNSVLVTTLSAPIIANGKFIGIVGVDINLPVVQTWLAEQANALFKGQSSLTLVSQKKLIVASTKYEKLIGENVDKAEAQLQNIINSDENVKLADDQWHVKINIPIKAANVAWTLIVSVPKDVALAPVIKMKAASDTSYNGAITSLTLYSLAFLVAAIVFSVWLSRSISAPIEKVSNSIQNLASHEGDLTQTVEIDNHKELILLASGFNAFMAKLADMISNSKGLSGQLVNQLSMLDHTATQVRTDTDKQQSNLAGISAAIHQMSTTATEVSDLANNAVDNAEQANTVLVATEQSLQETVNEVENLSKAMEDTTEQISNVAAGSQNITSIIATIQAIAEQTNLLALNAAIEAARAGEQGRGFAVVADEVRTLASRTQTSTQEISQLINNLQNDVNAAVSTLATIKDSVGLTVTKANENFEKLSVGLEGLQAISENVDQVSLASKQQSAASEEINSQVVAVTDSSIDLAKLGNDLQDMSADSQALIQQIDTELARLKS